MPKLGTIIITGAAGVIGSTTAQTLSKQGYKTLLVDRNKDDLIKVSKNIEHSKWLMADVANPQAVASMVDSVAKDLEGIVLAAGIEGPIQLMEDCADEDFHGVMTANVTSVWLGIKHALRVLKPKKHGSIVVLSSITGVSASPLLSPYCASKHAVLGLVKTAAREAAKDGVRVNAVCPGPVDSDMMERIDKTLLAKNPGRFGGNKTSAQSIPMQRYANPQEIANAIAFLCSEQSHYCTGSSMMIDGGFTCR